MSASGLNRQSKMHGTPSSSYCGAGGGAGGRGGSYIDCSSATHTHARTHYLELDKLALCTSQDVPHNHQPIMACACGRVWE